MGSPRGRPPLDRDSPSADVHLTVSARDYDQADRLAKDQRTSIQDVIRLGLKRLLDEHGNRI